MATVPDWSENSANRRNDRADYEKKPMTQEEVIEISKRMSEEAPKAAQKMIAASGQDPLEYSPLTRECMAALIYGMLGAASMEALGYHEWRWTGMEISIISITLLGVPVEQGVPLSQYLYENSSKQRNPDLNVNIHQLIHYGLDSYYLLDQPDRLEKAVQAILQACYKAFGTGEEGGQTVP